MRIDPDQQISPRLRPPTSAPSAAGAAFASTLAAVRDADGPGTASSGVATVEERPLAQRWGQYGLGAEPGGYGAPPDPAEFAAVATGGNVAAHPLNPEGESTTTPAFTVPGYSGRGTPIPPGFYNLAYYNQYLAEGGTPLEGFPAYDAAAGSIASVYGTYGDRRLRAVSIDGATSAGGEVFGPSPDATTASGGPAQAVSDLAAVAAGPESGAAPAPTPPTASATEETALGLREAGGATDVDAADASADQRLRAAAAALLAESARTAAHDGLAALLGDLIRTT